MRAVATRALLGRRLVPVSTLAIGAVAVAIVFAIALFAFGSYAGHTRRDADALVARAAAIARALPPHAGALEAARAIAQRSVETSLLVVFTDPKKRVTVLRDAGGDRPSFLVRERDDRRMPEAHGVLARLTLGLATAFGVATMRTHAGALDINVDLDQSRFVGDVRSFVPAFCVALVVALAIAASVASVVTRDATRPLRDVTRALERLSSGDFTRHAVAPGGQEQLGELARAYNGAVEQVEAAFAERARASEVMRRFIADGGHELRTPLTVIRGFVGILRSGLPSLSDGEIEHILNSMAQQVAIMGALVDKLVLLERWSERGAADERTVDLVGLVRDVVAPFALAHPERTISIDAPAATYISIDGDDVRQALANVVDNALKYASGEIEVVVRTSATEAELTVADKGPGMMPEHAQRAFDRFFRAERRDIEGSGLGLAIAKRAVERSSGRLTLKSSVAHGTRVRFAFPSHVEDSRIDAEGIADDGAVTS